MSQVDVIRECSVAPDVSVVVELAGVPHGEKIEYLHSLLPALADLRRRTGLPHRIIV